ncbi:MAG: GTPase ObgE [Deltaproteobacteria bacterium]
MRFVDEVEFIIAAGSGGNGCIAFRHEKYVPKGGPSGGDGGRGGSILLRADNRLTTLLDLRYRQRIEAQRGEHGRGKDQYGHAGADTTIRVPIGTLIKDAKTGETLADLKADEQEVLIARGGRGGLGNIHFTTSTRQAPREATEGKPGETRSLALELRLLADVGVVGFPNAGKSSLVARLSAARPKIADYPFTTLQPHLGVVRLDRGASFVIADVPGIIEGAHKGIGLGARFLRHLSRTGTLVHLIDLAAPGERDALEDIATIEGELEKSEVPIADKIRILVGNKIDLPEARERLETLREELAAQGKTILAISTATGEGLPELVRHIAQELRRAAEQSKAAEDLAETMPPNNAR